MFYHSTPKQPKNSTSLGQSKQSSIIPFPGITTADDAPPPAPAKQESKLDLWNTLLAANYDVDYECYMSLFYEGVTGFTWDEIYDLLDVPASEKSPFAYMSHIARLYMAVAFEMTRYEVATLNRDMELDEIYAVCEKNAAIAGSQARKMSAIMRIDLLSGESLEA